MGESSSQRKIWRNLHKLTATATRPEKQRRRFTEKLCHENKAPHLNAKREQGEDQRQAIPSLE